MMETLYSTKATATSGLYGHVTSDDNSLNAAVGMPQEMGGAGGTFLNPETLFAAGFAASFNNALNAVIRREKIAAGKTNTTAEVNVSKYGDNYKFNVRLEVQIPGVDTKNAEDLIKKAQQISAYSSAIRGNIEVNVIVKKEPVAENYLYY